MKRYIVAIGARYGALAIQFILVLLVARSLPQAQAGQYFVSFGLVATVFCLAGVGLPDGLVKSVGEDLSRQRADRVHDAIVKSGIISAITALTACALGSLVFLATGAQGDYVLLTAVWCFLYGMIFYAAQALVALRSAGLGAFFFYSSTNMYLLMTSVPYLLFWRDPTLTGLMFCTITAATLSLVTALVFLSRALSPHTGRAKADLGPAFRTGSVIAVSRMLQAMIYWIPVWVCGALLGAADASVIATAGRLLIAVSAVIAALRFSVRPVIVAAAAEGDWPAIERTGRKIALFTTLLTLLAMLLMALIGKPVLLFLLGEEYAAAWGVLFVLIFGALGEAFGGPVDEVLKMTGHTTAVLLGLLVTVVLETALAIFLSPHGTLAIATAQATAFCAMYMYQVLYLQRKRGILIMPLSGNAFRKA
ncbi:hypothetical protein CLG85_018945 [Yangia mangrovi]|nr:hypothetical protein [Alloyangia mangrovi]MCT4372280.1 hypothetical protein [Alloyangia mangrovi]